VNEFHDKPYNYKKLKIVSVYITSAVRAFCPDYVPHFASGLKPRHIGARPKGPFWPRLCLGSARTEAIG